MEKERKITAPEGCEIEKVELIDGAAVVAFREKERKLPKSFEEFCEMFPFEISRIKSQLLADITFEMVKKYDYVSYRDIEEIAKKTKMIVASVFGQQCEAKGGEE